MIKVSHVTYTTPLLTYVCIFWFVNLSLNLHAKFEVSSYTILQGVEFFCFPIDSCMDLTTVQRYCADCDTRHTCGKNSVLLNLVA